MPQWSRDGSENRSTDYVRVRRPTFPVLPERPIGGGVARGRFTGGSPRAVAAVISGPYLWLDATYAKVRETGRIVPIGRRRQLLPNLALVALEVRLHVSRGSVCDVVHRGSAMVVRSSTLETVSSASRWLVRDHAPEPLCLVCGRRLTHKARPFRRQQDWISAVALAGDYADADLPGPT